jgi:hypothetical protein
VAVAHDATAGIISSMSNARKVLEIIGVCQP